MKKEVKPRLRDRARNHALRFKRKFKKQMFTAVAAAFAFFVALSWREPISQLINKIIEILGLAEEAIYIEFLSAIIVTLLAVLALMLMSRWEAKE
jgi:hypothetical protein